MTQVPAIRIRACNRAPARPRGRYVLYWMTAYRRLHYNFALDRAIEHCRALKKPLVIFEPLASDYPWASDRFHLFVLEGMADQALLCRAKKIRYLPCPEPRPGALRGLLAGLARQACRVVTDDYPCFFLPRLVRSASANLGVALEAVDSNGLLPLRGSSKLFARAFDFRRFLDRNLATHLLSLPRADPLAESRGLARARVEKKLLAGWRPLFRAVSQGAVRLERFPLDHTVGPGPVSGGHSRAVRELDRFLSEKLGRYAERRNQPEQDATSNLSPYLHFGQLSSHEIFARLTPDERDPGWPNPDGSAQAFLDQLVTWRELGFNFAAHRRDYDRFSSLPAWAAKTLEKHAADRRDPLYSAGQFEAARTHDPLWNAAQTQLVREGKIHNYLRMLWGKKILEWSRSPKEAARIMIRLNDKYALDGRDPNSYSGIFWVLGRYDRPWGPERPVYGLLRYMSSENTARKFVVKNYLRLYAPPAGSSPAGRSDEPSSGL